MAYQDLDSIGRPAAGGTLLTQWGIQVDDNFKAIHDSLWQASAYRSTNQSIASSTLTALAFNSALFDPNSNFNLSTGVYTVPSTGYYVVTAGIVWSGISSATGTQFVQISQNGTEVKRGAQTSIFVGNPSSVASGLLKCTAGDTITAYGWQGNGIALNALAGQAFTYLDVAFLR